MSNPFVAYINGEYVGKSQAKISILDLGLTRGYGVFDFLRTYYGNPFYFKDHFQRLQESAKTLFLKYPLTADETKAIIQNLMRKNKQKEAAIKIILTAGETLHSLNIEASPTVIITTMPLAIYAPGCYSEGVKMVSAIHSPFISECKTLNYIPALRAMELAKKQGAFEPLFITKNKKILEGGTSNFFVFKKNVLITPKDNIIYGITRKVVLKLAKQKFAIEERDIHFDELKEIDEAFITASNKEIMPVRQIDDIAINAIGPNTSAIIQSFHEYTRGLHWLKEPECANIS